MTGTTQWRTADGITYMGVGETVPDLPPGIWDVVNVPNLGLVWERVEQRDDPLIRFDDSASLKVVDEIARFWQEEEKFRRYGLPFKRGILLHGPPGSGKSSTLRLIADDVVERGGYVLVYARPGILVAAVRQLRSVHPDAAVVVLMEDLDSILQAGDESSILNLLDGAERVDGIVFLATTNYPELLKERIRNRPSRFDRRVLIPHPTPAHRRQYLDSVVLPGDDYDLDRYVKDTEGMSLAHVKELFLATAVLGADYRETLKDLRSMAGLPTSAEDGGYQRPGNYA